MSELTLDEAIKHCLEVAARNEIEAKSMGYHFVGSQKAEAQNVHFECAADHRQLAEWLMELKELKNSVGAVMLSNMKEALELIREYKAENAKLREQIFEYKQLDEQIKELEAKHWDECRQIAHYDDELKEAKRLLKSAIDEWHIVVDEAIAANTAVGLRTANVNGNEAEKQNT